MAGLPQWTPPWQHARRRGESLLRGLSPGVAALAELLDHLLREGRDVVRLARGDEALVGDDLLVHPFRARVAQVGLQRGPGGHPAALHPAGIDQRPGTVADRRDR